MKAIVGTCLAACYLAALAAVVRQEGTHYRRELGRRRQATGTPVAAPATAIDERKSQPAATPPAVAPESPPELRDRPTPPASQNAAEPRPNPPAAAPSTIDPRPADLPQPSPEEGPAPPAEPGRPIAAGHPLREDPAATRRLEATLKHLAASRSRPQEAIAFHVLDSADVAAFSDMDGQIYVSSGAFALTQTDAELEFVVAHELAHAELEHTAAPREPLAAEQEFAADAWAYQALRRAGRSHRQSVGFLRRYATYDGSRDVQGHRASRTGPGDSRQDGESHYRAGPPASERLKRLEARK